MHFFAIDHNIFHELYYPIGKSSSQHHGKARVTISLMFQMGRLELSKSGFPEHWLFYGLESRIPNSDSIIDTLRKIPQPGKLTPPPSLLKGQGIHTGPAKMVEEELGREAGR